MWMDSRWAFLGSLLVVLGACDKRSAEEKGQDYAKEKLGFVEGAAKVLEERGKGLGRSVGKGVGEVARGAGSGVKDVTNRPVKVERGSELADTGLKILQAHEAGLDASGRGVIVYLEFPNAVDTKLRLHALADNDSELARAELDDSVNQAAGSQKSFTFEFPADMRLSSVKSYVLHRGTDKVVALDSALTESGIALSQLKEQGSEVTLYAIFSKPFSGGLQLRAKNGTRAEVGRSSASGKLAYAADSASYISFKFDARTPLGSVTEYTLYRVAPATSDAP